MSSPTQPHEALHISPGGQPAAAVVGSWGTKIERLVLDLRALEGTEEKALVFSAWDEVRGAPPSRTIQPTYTYTAWPNSHK